MLREKNMFTTGSRSLENKITYLQWINSDYNILYKPTNHYKCIQSIDLSDLHKFTNLELSINKHVYNQWEIQDPKMEVPYHIRPYLVGIFPYRGLIYGRYLQFRFLKWQLI